jgi:cephalosporin hydroxylase
VNGSSIDPDIVKSVKANVGEAKNVLVILDSDHSKDHVLAEMQAYKDLVPVGGYLIVEDTFLNGHPTHSDFGPGPMEAVDEFLAGDDRFIIDRTKEYLLFTLNRRGFLRRIK